MAEELHRSFSEAVNAAKRSASVTPAAETEQRVKQLRAQINRLQVLKRQIAGEVTAAPAPPPRAVAR
jgi:hypothetical protein